MAYKTYSRYKKYPSKTYKKYTPPSRYKIYSGAAGQLWKDVKMLKNMINIETKYNADKYNDATMPIITAVTTPLATLNGITEGDTQGQRSGISIKAKSLVVQGHFVWNASGAVSQTVRCVLVRQLSNRGADCIPADIFDINNCPLSGANPDYTLALYNKISCKTNGYIIMSDKTYNLSANKPEVKWKIVKGGKYHVKYNGTGSAVSAIEQNLVQLFVFTDQVGFTPTGGFTYHYNFIDN